MKTVILPTHTQRLFEQAVERAAELLRAGQLVALPTETVYGLAANALDAGAVARVFEAKGRPAHNPIIVHVANVAMAQSCVSEWPEAAERLASAFWPGPLTLVLRRSPGIPEIVTASGPTVGVRWPSHPLVQQVIRLCDFPLAMPSANPAGQLSPTTAAHAAKALQGKIPLVVDGGPAQVGIESTVLDLSRRPARVLRPGMIQAETLMAVIGEECESSAAPKPRTPGGILRSPGQLPKHYSPKAKLVVWQWRDAEDLKSQILGTHFDVAKTHVIAHSHIPSPDGFCEVKVIPHDPEAFARALYAELHRCDEAGAQLIVVEAVPAQPAWQGLRDRLERAASPS